MKVARLLERIRTFHLVFVGVKMVNISIDNGILQCYFLNFSLDNPPAAFGIGIFTILIDIITAPMAVIGNLLIIIAIIKTPTLQTPSNFLISSLAISDLTTGLLCQPTFVVYKIAEFKMDVHTTCIARTVADTISYVASAMSFVTLSMIAIERYLALHFHLRYHQLVSITKTAIPVVSMWVVFTTLSVSRFFTAGQDLFTISISIIFFIIVFVTFWAYAKIFQIVRRHRCQIQSQQRLSNRIADPEREGNQGESLNRFQMARYRRSTYTMFLVLGLFVVTYGPLHIVQMALKTNIVVYNSAVKIAMLVIVTIIFVTATINPLLYCLRIQPLRRACFKLLPFVRNENQNETVKTETGVPGFHMQKSVWQ